MRAQATKAGLPLRGLFSFRAGRTQSPRPPVADSAGNHLLPVLSAEALLGDRNRAAMVKQLRKLTSTTDTAWDVLYADLLRRFASFVQQLPASEAHHHAYPGGLLDHALDVSRNALLLRRSYLLPPGLPPEEASRNADRWTFATFAAALLHDVGKPATDQVVEIFLPASGSRRWSAWSGPMPIGASYRVTFATGRSYADHDAAAAFIARRLIPPRALEWMSGDNGALLAMLGSLSRSTTLGPIGEIVVKADGASAAEALGGDRGQFLSSRRQSLSSVGRIVIRELIETGEIPLNRPGAGAFSDDADLWLVNKRFLNLFRTVLEDRGVHVPPRNTELMDELTAHRVVVPTASGKATWRAQITMPEEEFDQSLTFVRVRLADLYPGGEGAPDPIAGSVTPQEAKEDTTEPEDEAAPPKRSQQPRSKPQPKTKKKAKTMAERFDKALGGTPAEDEPAGEVPELPEDEVGPEPIVYEELEGLDEADEGTSKVATPPDDPPPRQTRTEKGADLADRNPAEPQAFIEWIKAQVASGELAFNKPDTPLHVVEEGLFMVSPKIFRDYGGEKRYQHVERCFVRAKLHRRPEKGKGNIRVYEVTGERKAADLKGLLVPDGLGLTLPAPNPSLRPKPVESPPEPAGKARPAPADD